MPRSKAQQDGIDFEKRFADLIGGQLTPGSGNQWYAKLDVSSRGILFSLKHTGKNFFRITKDVLREAIVAANQEGCIPAWALDIAGEDFILMRGHDFRMLMEEDHKVVAKSKRTAKRKRAATPVLMRDKEE
jgi:hypothetical protein